MCGGILKSDTISFGQALVPEVIDRAMAVSRSCDVLLAVGSTLSVYPAASCVPLAAAAGARVAIINGGPTEMDRARRCRAARTDLRAVAGGRRRGGTDRVVIYHAALPADWDGGAAVGHVRDVDPRAARWPTWASSTPSYEHQVEGVANRFYADVDELVLLVIDRDAVGSPVVDESPTGDPADEHFPHIYGPLPVDAVVDARLWKRRAGSDRGAGPGRNPDQTGRV